METLDLDLIAPEIKKVKIGGKLIDVHPVKVKNLIEMQRLFLNLQALNGKPEEQLAAMASIIDVLRPIVPDIDSVDFTMEQLTALLQFASSQGEQKKGAQNPTSDSE
jgi:hypothetical protein